MSGFHVNTRIGKRRLPEDDDHPLIDQSSGKRRRNSIYDNYKPFSLSVFPSLLADLADLKSFAVPYPLRSPKGSQFDMEMEDNDINMSTSLPNSPDSSVAPCSPKSQIVQSPSSSSRIPTPTHSTIHHSSPNSPDASIVNQEDHDDILKIPSTIQQTPSSTDLQTPSPRAGDVLDTPTTLPCSERSRLSEMEASALDDFYKMKSRPRPRMDKIKIVLGCQSSCEKCRAQVPGHFIHFLPLDS